MLRRNFMSMLGLSGFGSLLGKNVPASPSIDLDKIYRIEEKNDHQSRIKYLKICESASQEQTLPETYLVVNGELTKNNLVYHNPNGPASITKYYYKQQNLCTNYSWHLNGKRGIPGSKLYLISVKKNIFHAYFSDAKVIIFNLETDSKEQFESQIGMTIEKLLSCN